MGPASQMEPLQIPQRRKKGPRVMLVAPLLARGAFRTEPLPTKRPHSRMARLVMQRRGSSRNLEEELEGRLVGRSIACTVFWRPPLGLDLPISLQQLPTRQQQETRPQCLVLVLRMPAPILPPLDVPRRLAVMSVNRRRQRQVCQETPNFCVEAFRARHRSEETPPTRLLPLVGVPTPAPRLQVPAGMQQALPRPAETPPLSFRRFVLG